jgi:hypothetical protein
VSVFTNPASRSAEHAEAYTRAVLELVTGVDPVGVLRETPAALRGSVAGLSQSQVGRPEAPGKWSMRHVLRHLADSELVWGYRLRMVLAHDRPPLTGYDQDAWADRLGYADADVEQALADFGVLRRSNLDLLDRASAEDMRRVGVHVERGEESVEHMIRLYAGHDVLHLRQLDRIRAAVTSEVRS